jgi:hypothetical protein
VPSRRRLRRIWWRAGVACALYLAAALALPRVQRALDPQHERRASVQSREQAPVYVMPNGERRRTVVVTRPDPSPVGDSRGNRALLWWCGILAIVTIAGAVAQTIRVYLGDDEEARP